VSQPLSLLLQKVREVGDAWRDEAKRLKRRHEADPVCAVLISCADDLDEHLQRLMLENTPLTVKQYSDEHGVWPSTVRRWIARGELEAVQNDAGDWQIPRDARRQKHHMRIAS
jgi:hypothetical protein